MVFSFWHIYIIIYKIDNNKKLLYSAGNSTQFSVMAFKGKEFFKKEWVYVYVQLIHFAGHLK